MERSAASEFRGDHVQRVSPEGAGADVGSSQPGLRPDPALGPPVRADTSFDVSPPRVPRATPPVPDLPVVDFSTIADHLFVALQHEAERIAVLRVLINDGTTHRATGEAKLAEAEARAKTLTGLFNLFYSLVPRERDVRRLVAGVLAGDRVELVRPFGLRG